MEVERVQDGPLKKSEIVRFLEASKTSYKTVDNFLNEKKEPVFQHRTLLEIASETQLRSDISKDNTSTNTDEEEQNDSKTDEDRKASEEEAAKQEVEKRELELTEKKKKEEEHIAQQEKDKANYERGFSEGKTASDLDAKNKLENGLLALENARKSVLDLNASHFIRLRDQIAGQILALSSERTGLEIKKLPEHFFTKIESLIETIGHTTQSPLVYLNPSDLESIEAIVEEQKENLNFSFHPDEGLVSGDVVIDIGSISIRDVAKERSNISNDDYTPHSAKQTKVLDKPNQDETEASEKNDADIKKDTQGEQSTISKAEENTSKLDDVDPLDESKLTVDKMDEQS